VGCGMWENRSAGRVGFWCLVFGGSGKKREAESSKGGAGEEEEKIEAKIP
jgi:hypothetical protein